MIEITKQKKPQPLSYRHNLRLDFDEIFALFVAEICGKEHVWGTLAYICTDKNDDYRIYKCDDFKRVTSAALEGWSHYLPTSLYTGILLQKLTPEEFKKHVKGKDTDDWYWLGYYKFKREDR